MDSSDAIQLLVLVLLLFLSAFFSSAETALTTVNRIRVRTLAEAGNKQAIMLSKIIEQQGKMLSAVLIGNNVANISASSLATTLAINAWGSKSVGIVTGLLTLIILVFGEITPKTLSSIYSEKLALKYAGAIHILIVVFIPVVFFVNQLSVIVLFILRIDSNKKNDGMTEDELRTIVEVSHEEGVIESEEKKMINNVFDFGDSLAKDVMCPRVDMIFVPAEATYEEVIEIYRGERYTRYPVYEESTDNVIGILNMKDLLLQENNVDFSVRNLLREPLYTYEFKKTAELMLEMRQTFNNIVIVLDEYGSTAGLITLEDMLEEIVGEIRDEYDQDEIDIIVEVSPNEYLIEGSIKLDDINEFLDLSLESEDYDSIGGLIIGLLDHLPEEGEEVEHLGLRLIVDHVEKNRIDKVRLVRLEPEELPAVQAE